MMSSLLNDSCLLAKQRALRPMVSNGNLLRQEVNEDYQAVSWIASVIELSSELISIEGDVFCLRKLGGQYAVVFTDCLKLKAEWMVSVIKNAPSIVVKSFPYHDFNPVVLVFFERLSARRDLKILIDALKVPMTEEDAIAACAQLNKFFNEYREFIASDDFKLRCKKMKRAALKNYKGMMRRVKEMFELRARLLVVRVDLFYLSDDAHTQDTGRTVSVDKVVADRRLFLKALYQRDFSESLISHCWKLEFASKKGFHYHCMFFFDGAKVREGITLGRLIGEVWEEVTGLKNVYWNCNASESRYTHRGVGMISHDDPQGWIGLEYAIAYLTKPDYFLCLSNQVVGDTFGKGKIRIVKSNRGRPRMASSEIAV